MIKPKKHLFLTMINNSGSSMVMDYIAASRSATCLRQKGEDEIIEGQFVVKPGLMPEPGLLGVRRIWSEKAELFEDISQYNWPEIKKIWNELWELNSDGKQINGLIAVEKSSPNVFRAPMLEAEFENAYFLIMHRNPYAVVEGMNRRQGYSIERCVKHWISVTRKQIENINVLKRAAWFTYEELVERPNAVRQRIVEFLPELEDLSFSSKTARHSIVGTDMKELQNFNSAQIDRLESEQVTTINSLLRENMDLLEFFGYLLLNENMRWKGSRFIKVWQGQSPPDATVPASTIEDRKGADGTATNAFDRLSQLKKMLDAGLITAQDYDQKKAQILNDL
jgi:hypothetical protein